MIAASDDIVDCGGFAYFPRTAVQLDVLEKAPKTDDDRACPHGVQFYDAVIDGRRHPRAAWSYEAPTLRFSGLRGHLALYAGRMDECRVDGELVTPQPGGFYGGWITAAIKGPFKGTPGSLGW